MLSGQKLPRERGQMRVHQLQNIQIALNYIRFRKVKLVNIRPEDIVDGNRKLILGLIWTIILHFQVISLAQFNRIKIFHYLVVLTLSRAEVHVVLSNGSDKYRKDIVWTR